MYGHPRLVKEHAKAYRPRSALQRFARSVLVSVVASFVRSLIRSVLSK